jgi:hypothetical protein
MKTINEKSRSCASPTLAPSPALEFVLALARHRATLDHMKTKLTITNFETIDSKSVTCNDATVDDAPVVINQEVQDD